MKQKEINQECSKWKNKLLVRGYYCVFKNGQTANRYGTVGIYSTKFNRFMGEFTTPRQAYKSIFQVTV